MGDLRARDADRDRYVDVIEAAYADGQLGSADRELRVSRALTAETLGELDGLTRDLQNRPAPVVVIPTPAPRVVTSPPDRPAPDDEPVTRPVPSKDLVLGKVLGPLAAGILLVVVFEMATSAPDEVRPFGEEYPYAKPWNTGADRPELAYALSEAKVRAFVRRYDARFATSQAQGVTLFADRARVRVPDDGSRSPGEPWTWAGEWSRSLAGDSEDVSTGAVDLSRLDVEALFRNVEAATGGPGAPDADVQRIELRPTRDGQGAVRIHVRDGTGQSATLDTTLQGDQVGEVPFAG